VAFSEARDARLDAGASVIVIEHDPEVIAHADRVIDMGPGARRDGGWVVFEGTPEELVEHPEPLAGRHLAMRHA
jgi:excinuclease UvrABC ATPase subunit